jgi:hypothetical protein
MTDLAKPEQQLLDLLQQHNSLGNGKARELLGLDEALYEQDKGSLVAAGQVVLGRGRGGSTRLEEPSGIKALGLEAAKPKGPQAKRPESPKATELNGYEPKGSGAERPLSLQAFKPLGQVAPSQQANKPLADQSQCNCTEGIARTMLLAF